MISNSSPLIAFGKVNRLELLLKMFGKIEITESVYDEVVKKGKEFNKSEAFLIEEYIQKGHIKIMKLIGEYERKSSFLIESNLALDKGECDTLALALQEKKKNVLMDEKIARKVARLYEISPIGVLGILLLCYRKNFVSEKEIREIVEKLVMGDFRFGAEVIHEFWRMLERVKGRRIT
jgi:predicted nucleic acid-binding protein